MKDRELLQRLKELTAEGYIETEQLERIENEYFKEETHEKKLMFSFALLGVLFIGIGLISICAFNWSYLSQSTRLVVGFGPLIGTQILLCLRYKRGASRIWIESLCLGVGLTFLLAIGVVYQVYQVSMGLDIVFLITFLVMLPVIYCCEAYYLSILCLSGVVLYTLAKGAAFYNILVLLIFPYYIKCLKGKTQRVGLLSLGLVIWLIEFLYFTLDYFEINHLIAYMLVFIVMTRTTPGMLFRKVGLVAYYFLNFWVVVNEDFPAVESLGKMLPALLLLIVLGVIFYIDRDKDKNEETGILLLQPILLCVGGVIGSSLMLTVSFNVYVVGSILYLLFMKGYQEKSIHKMRLGTWLLCIYALIKLCSFDVALLAKGTGFIVAGMILLGVNIWLSHLVRRAHNE